MRAALQQAEIDAGAKIWLDYWRARCEHFHADPDDPGYLALSKRYQATERRVIDYSHIKEADLPWPRDNAALYAEIELRREAKRRAEEIWARAEAES